MWIYKLLTKEKRMLEELCAEQGEIIQRQKDEIDYCRQFLNSLSTIADGHSHYEHQILKTKRGDKEEYFVVLRKKENISRNDTEYSCTFVLYALYHNEEICFADIKVHFPSWSKRGVVRLERLLTINESNRSKGYGGFLIEYLKRYCRFCGYEKIYGDIDCFIPNEIEKTQKFYKKNGFTISHSGHKFSVLFNVVPQ